jgi:hypothetical protein
MPTLEMYPRLHCWLLGRLRHRFCSSLPGFSRKRYINDALRSRGLSCYLLYHIAALTRLSKRRFCAGTWPEYQLQRCLCHHARPCHARPYHHRLVHRRYLVGFGSRDQLLLGYQRVCWRFHKRAHTECTEHVATSIVRHHTCHLTKRCRDRKCSKKFSHVRYDWAKSIHAARNSKQ